MDEKVRKLFYGLYPDSDPKYYGYFGFGENVDGGELRSIDVWYKHNLKYKDYIEIIKGKNDEDPRWKKYLHSYNFPRLWRLGGSLPRFVGYSRYTLPYQLHNFRVYVSEEEYFMSRLPPVSASWAKGKTFDETTAYDIRKVPLDYSKEPYFAMISAAYIATYLCGISMEHLDPPKSNDVPNLITTIMRYHLYYTIRKFMKQPSLMDQYHADVKVVKKNIPTKRIDVESKGTDDDGNKYVFDGYIERSDRDYLNFIARESNGLTTIGQELLQQSIESFVYSILGAQASTRWVIVGDGAKSSQTQDAFRKKVEDTVVQSDTTVLVSNMRRAIKDTNVVLNMAISPGIILVPSDMKILEKKIPGYNNTLTEVTSSMEFGVNASLNHTAEKERTIGVGTSPIVPRGGNKLLQSDPDSTEEPRVDSREAPIVPIVPRARSSPPTDSLITMAIAGGVVTYISMHYLL